VENLHKLFGVVAEYPRLWPLVRRHIGRKPNRLFVLAFFLWYGYCWKTRIERMPFSPRTVFSLLKTFVEYLRGVKELAPPPAGVAPAEIC
jgi:hypothetical protein